MNTFDAIILALAIAESGCDDKAVGQLGERTRWQIMPATWAAYSRVPIRRASVSEAERVARAIWQDEYERSRQFLKRTPTLTEVYLGWRMGYPKASRARFDLRRVNKQLREEAAWFHRLATERQMDQAAMLRAVQQAPGTGRPMGSWNGFLWPSEAWFISGFSQVWFDPEIRSATSLSNAAAS